MLLGIPRALQTHNAGVLPRIPPSLLNGPTRYAWLPPQTVAAAVLASPLLTPQSLSGRGPLPAPSPAGRVHCVGAGRGDRVLKRGPTRGRMVFREHSLRGAKCSRRIVFEGHRVLRVHCSGDAVFREQSVQGVMRHAGPWVYRLGGIVLRLTIEGDISAVRAVRARCIGFPRARTTFSFPLCCFLHLTTICPSLVVSPCAVAAG